MQIWHYFMNLHYYSTDKLIQITQFFIFPYIIFNENVIEFYRFA